MADSAEDQRHNLTHAIGECILAWAKVEQALAVLFGVVIQKDGIKASMMFEAVISLEVRVDLIAPALKWMTDSPKTLKHLENLEKWDVLSKKIKDKYKKRHQIAHSNIVLVRKGKNRKECRLLPFPTIGKTVLALSEDSEQYVSTLGLSELSLRREKFIELSEEILSFRRELVEYQKQLQTYRE